MLFKVVCVGADSVGAELVADLIQTLRVVRTNERLRYRCTHLQSGCFGGVNPGAMTRCTSGRAIFPKLVAEGRIAGCRSDKCACRRIDKLRVAITGLSGGG